MTVAEEQTSIANAKTICRVNRHGSHFAITLSPLKAPKARSKRAQQSPRGLPVWRNLKKIHAAGVGCMVKSMYFASRTVELVDQPPA